MQERTSQGPMGNRLWTKIRNARASNRASLSRKGHLDNLGGIGPRIVPRCRANDAPVQGLACGGVRSRLANCEAPVKIRGDGADTTLLEVRCGILTVRFARPL